MQHFRLILSVGISMLALIGTVGAQQTPNAGPYKLLKTTKVGGSGGFDYVFADSDARRLYIPRGGTPGRVAVFHLDTLAPVGEIPNTSARGAAVDPKSGHGFASSKPVIMWDTKTLATIKTIDVDGGPDGILFEYFDENMQDRWALSIAQYVDAWNNGTVYGAVIDKITVPPSSRPSSRCANASELASA